MNGLGQKLLLETPLHSDYTHSHTQAPSPMDTQPYTSAPQTFILLSLARS